jgi:hypothetical protein
MKKYIIFDISILVLLFIAWEFGVISLVSLGRVMLGFGVLWILFFTLALLGARMFTGDVSIFLAMNEILGIRTIKNKLSISFIFQIIGIGLIQVLVGVIIQLLR